MQGNRAIVVDEPGVTRDRLYGRSYWGDQEFMVIDTGGVITLSKSQAGVMEELAVTTTVGMDGIPLATREAAIARMPSMIEKQAVAAVDEASVILFVVDGQAGLINYLFFWVLSSAYLVFEFISTLNSLLLILSSKRFLTKSCCSIISCKFRFYYYNGAKTYFRLVLWQLILRFLIGYDATTLTSALYLLSISVNLHGKGKCKH